MALASEMTFCFNQHRQQLLSQARGVARDIDSHVCGSSGGARDPTDIPEAIRHWQDQIQARLALQALDFHHVYHVTPGSCRRALKWVIRDVFPVR